METYALRLASLEAEKRTEEDLAQLTLADVSEFDPKKDELLNSGQNRIGFGRSTGGGTGAGAS